MIVFKFPNVRSSDKPQMQMWKANVVLALGNGWVHCTCKKAPLLFRHGCKLPFWYNPWISGLGTQKLAQHIYCSPIIPNHQSSAFCQHWAALIPRAGSHRQACTSMSPAAHVLSYFSLLSLGAPGPVLPPQMVLLLSMSQKSSVAMGNPELEGVLSCQSMGTAPTRVEVGSFPHEVKAALLKAADRSCRQNVHGSLPWGPAGAVCTFISTLPFPVPCLGCPAALPEDGIHVPSHPCPCWLFRPPGSLGRLEAASDASGTATGEMDLRMIWSQIICSFCQSEKKNLNKIFHLYIFNLL